MLINVQRGERWQRDRNLVRARGDERSWRQRRARAAAPRAGPSSGKPQGSVNELSPQPNQNKRSLSRLSPGRVDEAISRRAPMALSAQRAPCSCPLPSPSLPPFVPASPSLAPFSLARRSYHPLVLARSPQFALLMLSGIPHFLVLLLD